MLIGVTAGPVTVRCVFRAQGGVADVIRSVDLSWEEVTELSRQLTLLLEQDPYRVPEQERWRDLKEAE